MLGNREIQNIIPHRYPFILVDRIVEMEEGKRAVGTKNVSANEPFFQGHFPGYPIMPGVLIMEALAQVGAVLILSKAEYKGSLAFYAGLDEVRFKRQVIPGDILRLETELVKMKGTIGVAWGEAYVGDELAAKGKIMFAIGPKSSR
ncbi:MAG: 3-hydroxyacyl-ACP dehydratase FabZ [Desulfitobacteriaceae bacterium]|nr:3-hydroxyacyl-ACP dehydratase FabZ [Desulfitobacteriaceae bacterium]MDD4345283.1 3-hydroxyacyl-ACP dehydratase FabZ [Desulfitobacteriaceae bacterium]MDD4400465.1 3-hydroxyacyl-ACP dehydratase FabZ [Desulfitobacteriaceae bacterium]